MCAMNRGVLGGVVFASAVVLVGSCGGGGWDWDIDLGYLTVRLADSAVDDALAVVVQVEAVDARVSGAHNPGYDYDRFKIQPVQQINLLALSDGRSELLLKGVVLSADRWDWMRLVIRAGINAEDSWVETATGRHALFLPESNERSLLVPTSFVVPKNGTVDLTIDFDEANWERLQSNPHNPLLNRAISGLYPPGSTFKMVTALAALEAGKVSLEERVICRGAFDFADQIYRCWKRDGHGPMDLNDALRESCDVYFYDLAERITVNRIASMARRLDLGQIYACGIGGQNPGLIPDTDWKRVTNGERWLRGETILAGIGQDYVLATPLQLAVMTARLATGRAVVPTLVRRPGEVLPDTPLFRRLMYPQRGWKPCAGLWSASSTMRAERAPMPAFPVPLSSLQERRELPKSAIPQTSSRQRRKRPGSTGIMLFSSHIFRRAPRATRLPRSSNTAGEEGRLPRRSCVM